MKSERTTKSFDYLHSHLHQSQQMPKQLGAHCFTSRSCNDEPLFGFRVAEPKRDCPLNDGTEEAHRIKESLKESQGTS